MTDTRDEGTTAWADLGYADVVFVQIKAEQ